MLEYLLVWCLVMEALGEEKDNRKTQTLTPDGSRETEDTRDCIISLATTLSTTLLLAHSPQWTVWQLFSRSIPGQTFWTCNGKLVIQYHSRVTGRAFKTTRLRLLGAFAKLRTPTISFVISVYPFVRMEQLSSHWTDFDEIWCLRVFRKSVKKIQVSLKTVKNNG